MAACYHKNATLTDIAFRLKSQTQIHAMWHMICANGIEVHVEKVKSDGATVRAAIPGGVENAVICGVGIC
ncbi:hypothetical protein CA85_51690 [Allorhodopirellula solitaria]|uniref:Uncharacterized protein n=1 Tax=Allorhodopirellula solitaria TaxID=2527987 RepID=A0A5C5WNV3_9BACT|nr:hypothetical protein CA85_51690 [Allorhodopirellula solitaria]